MYRLKVIDHFSAAHQLKGYQGECEELHGHNWKVEVEVQGDRLNSVGLLFDFKQLRQHLSGIIGEMDHSFLNDLPAFRDANPSSEQLARHIYTGLKQRLPSLVSPVSVTVWESENACATYHE